MRFLHDAVVRRLNACPAGTKDVDTGECVYMGALPDQAGYWLELPMADDVLRFEFSRDRVGYRIPFTLSAILVGGVLLTLMLGAVFDAAADATRQPARRSRFGRVCPTPLSP